MIRMTFPALVAGALLLTLSACTGGPAVEPTDEPVSTSTPTETPEVEAPLVLGPDGFGGFVLGAAPDADEVAAYATFVPGYCIEAATAEGFDYPADQDPDRWRPAGDYAEPSAFGVQIRDGLVTRVDAHTPTIETEAGIRVGSTADEVLAAYPDAEVTEFPTSDVYVVVGDAGLLLIEVARDRGGMGWMDQADTVLALNATISEFGVFNVANSDNRAGEC